MTQASPLRIVALGSSFAAGPGLAPLSDVRAGRSTVNYPNILAKLLSAHLTDLTVSGATLQNILSESQSVSGHVFPPQLSLLPEDADIVTITAGGNDMRYIGGLGMDALSRVFGVGWILSGLIRMRTGTLAEPVSSEEVINRFCAIIDQIHTRAPKARIFLVEYLTVLGETFAQSSIPS